MGDRGGLSEHLVQIYDDEEDLVRCVLPYLTAALTHPGAVLVLAVPEHRARFAQGLAEAGLDVAALAAAERYTALDAAQTLAALTGDDGVDDRVLEAAVGARLRRLVADHGAVTTYGEMVSLLWRQGRPAAAVALERAWNRLARDVGVRVFCGYDGASFDREGTPTEVRAVFDAHSTVLCS